MGHIERPGALLVTVVLVACSSSLPAPTETPTSGSASPPTFTPAASPTAAGSQSPEQSPTGSALRTSYELIDEALQGSAITEEQAALYSTFAAFEDPRLPPEYAGEQSRELEPPIDFTRVEAALNGFSAGVRDQLAPFFIPPMYRGSWWDLRHDEVAIGPAVARGAVAQATPSSPILDDQWRSVSTENGRVRIWYPLDSQELAGLATSTASEIDFVIWPRLVALMGSEPLPDAGAQSPFQGPDDALDMVLQNETGWANTYGRAPNLCERTAAWILFDPAAVTELGVPWNSAVAHELMHAFAYALDLSTLAGGPGGCADLEYEWWAEATATWVEEYVYPDANSEWAGERGTRSVTEYMKTLDRGIGLSGAFDVARAGGRPYGSYLFPFYLARRFGDQIIAAAWGEMAASESESAIDRAIRAAASDGNGLDPIWAEFAVDVLNEPPFDFFRAEDGVTHNALDINRGSSFGESFRQIDVEIRLGTDSEAVGEHDGWLAVDWPRGNRQGTGGLGLEAMAMTYSHYRFPDPNVRTVGWYNGMTHLRQTETGELGSVWYGEPRPAADIEGLRVQAMLKIDGHGWVLEDWTSYPWRTFCRDVAAERLTELIVVVSNGRADERFIESPPIFEPDQASRLWVSDMGCYRWQGTMSLEHNRENFHLTIDAENVLLERDPATLAPYGPNGTINFVVMGGQMRWDLSNSDDLCIQEGEGTTVIEQSLAITTMNFVVEGPWYRSGGGQITGAEGTDIPITCGGEPQIPSHFVPTIGLPPDGSPGKIDDGGHWTGRSAFGDVLVTWDLTAVGE